MRITESQLRNVVKQELKTLLEIYKNVIIFPNWRVEGTNVVSDNAYYSMNPEEKTTIKLSLDGKINGHRTSEEFAKGYKLFKFSPEGNKQEYILLNAIDNISAGKLEKYLNI